MNYFEVKVRFYQTAGDALSAKRTCHTYLVETETFGHAEQTAIEKVQPYADKGFGVEVVSIKRVSINEIVFNGDGHCFFLAKVKLISYNERSGKEEKSSVNVLVQSNSIEEANKEIKAVFAYSVYEWSVDTLKETPIIEVLGIRQEHVDAANNS